MKHTYAVLCFIASGMVVFAGPEIPTNGNENTILHPSAVIVQDHAFGGSKADVITCMKRTKDGLYVVGGWTTSDDFGSLFGGGEAETPAQKKDGFVAIVSANGQDLQSYYRIAATNNDVVFDLAIGSKGEIYVVGSTDSPDFPVKGSTVGQKFGGGTDGFLICLSPDLSQQTLGILLPGNGDDVARGVAVTSTGNIVVVGSTSSSTGITAVKVADDTLRGGTDGFVYILNSSLLYADFFTHIGGSKNDVFNKVVLDKQNAALICGTTYSSDYYTFPKKTRIPTGGGGRGGKEEGGDEGGYEETGKNPYNHIFNGGETDAIVAKVTSAGDLEYSTYFGGSGADEGVDLFADSEGNAVIVGNTTSPNLPVESSGTNYAGGGDAYLAAISSDGLRLSGAIYLGGAESDQVAAVVQHTDRTGAIVGVSQSTDFPVKGIGAKPLIADPSSGFLALVNVNTITFSSGLNIRGIEQPMCAVLDAHKDVVMAGTTQLPQQPITDDATVDMFIAKWAFGVLNYAGPLPADALCAGKSVTVRWTAEGIDIQEPVSVWLSEDDGDTWTEVGSNIKSRTYTFNLPTSLSTDATCRFEIRGLRGHTAQSPVALTIAAEPVISESPVSIGLCPNESGVLSVAAAGKGATYQWRKNGQNIAGATSADLSIAAATESDNGLYDVVIANTCGTVTSEAAHVVVSSQPHITEQPKSAAVELGQTVTFSVAALGQRLKYQWQHNGVAVADADQATFTIQSATASDAGEYACAITSDCGTVTTVPATLSITGISNVEVSELSDAMLRVYPNPTNGIAVVTAPVSNAAQRISIFGLSGQEVYSWSVPANYDQQLILPAGILSPGLYTIVSNANATITSSRFVVVP